MSDIYSLFEKTFREDSEFWYKLSQEELSHSITLQAERDSFFEEGLLPVELVQVDLETLRKQNSILSGFYEELKISAPSREQAFSIAYAGALVALLVLIFGAIYFRRMERVFVDVI